MKRDILSYCMAMGISHNPAWFFTSKFLTHRLFSSVNDKMLYLYSLLFCHCRAVPLIEPQYVCKCEEKLALQANGRTCA